MEGVPAAAPSCARKWSCRIRVAAAGPGVDDGSFGTDKLRQKHDDDDDVMSISIVFETRPVLRFQGADDAHTISLKSSSDQAGTLLDDIYSSPDKRFPLNELSKKQKPEEENKDGSDTEDDDEDDDEDNAEPDDDDAGDEDFSAEEGEEEADPEDDPEANGQGASDKDDEDDEDDDDDGDEEDDDEDGDEDEDEEEEDDEVPQPPSKKRK